MPLLVHASRRSLDVFRFRTLRIAAFVFAACSALAMSPRRGFAQLVLSHADDATPVPKGMLRIDATSSWTRFDERFSSSGRQSLGDALSTDSLGANQFPGLVPVQAGLQTLANNSNLHLSLGQLVAQSNVRVVVAPVSFEYGLTKRLSVGISVPFIQTRRSLSLKVNPDSTKTGNVGWVGSISRPTAAAQNLAVYTAFKSASDSLTRLVANCPGNPGASGCAAVNANSADAAAAGAQALAYANAVRNALGTDVATTMVAPRAASALALSIDTQRMLINAHLQQYLGASAGASSGIFTAQSNFSYLDLQGHAGTAGLLQSALGGGLDSIATINHTVLGAPTIGAQFLLLDTFQTDTTAPKGVQTRLLIGGTFRFSTGIVDSSHTTLAIPADDGSAIGVKSALDIIFGRFAGSVAARYVQSFARTVEAPLIGDPEALFPAPTFGLRTRTAGTIIGLDLTPRYLLSEYLALDGHYGYERTGAPAYSTASSSTPCAGCASLANFIPNTAASTAQRIGIGFRYSTVQSYLGHRAQYPLDVSYTHLATISGDPGVAAESRDQIQVRLYFRLFSDR